MKTRWTNPRSRSRLIRLSVTILLQQHKRMSAKFGDFALDVSNVVDANIGGYVVGDEGFAMRTYRKLASDIMQRVNERVDGVVWSKYEDRRRE